jgi:adenosine/AMP kinase
MQIPHGSASALRTSRWKLPRETVENRKTETLKARTTLNCIRKGERMLEFKTVKIEPVKDCNVILGMAHFIKTVEDLYEALVNAVPNIRFGIGFCESSGPCLVRSEGNDEELKHIATEKALKIACGHSFLIYIKNAYPLNVLDKIKHVPEVCTIYAATANPLEIIIAETEQGRGIIGVVDGLKSRGVETGEDAKERREFLRKIGYKLG